MLDLTINLGNVLTALVFLIGAVAFVYSVKADARVLDVRLTSLNAQMDDMQVEIKKLNDVMVLLAQTAGRLALIEERALLQGRRIDGLDVRVNRMEIRP